METLLKIFTGTTLKTRRNGARLNPSTRARLGGIVANVYVRLRLLTLIPWVRSDKI